MAAVRKFSLALFSIMICNELSELCVIEVLAAVQHKDTYVTVCVSNYEHGDAAKLLMSLAINLTYMGCLLTQ